MIKLLINQFEELLRQSDATNSEAETWEAGYGSGYRDAVRHTLTTLNIIEKLENK